MTVDDSRTFVRMGEKRWPNRKAEAEGQMNLSEDGRKEGRLVVVRGNLRQFALLRSELKKILAMNLLVNCSKITHGMPLR